MADIHVVVLAAGQGTRMKSRRPKVLHQVGGLSLIERVLRTAKGLAPASITVVVGHGADEVKASLAPVPGIRFALQAEQKGTGHALLQARPSVDGHSGTLVLLSGDAPLLRTETLRALVDRHVASQAAATVLTATMAQPYGYGRIIRTAGRITAIVEERDASPEQRAIGEINSGIYAFDLAPLFPALERIGTANTQGEYYLPDLVGIYRAEHRVVETCSVDCGDEIRGINTRAELAEVGRMVREQKNASLMAAGVTLVDPAATYVDTDVTVGADTIIHPGVTLEGRTTIGAGCELHSGTRVVYSTVGDGVMIRNHTVITDSVIGAGAVLGPFAHIRPGSDVGDTAHVGNFVELKKTALGAGAKANHLAYLGDATIGPKANIGAGTITCNYDGQSKHQTRIGGGAFVGSNSTLVAPITIGDSSYIGAGSTITHDVPDGALAIGRAHQMNKDGWAERRRLNVKREK